MEAVRMSEGVPELVEVTRHDRIELIRFFRALTWFAVARIAFWSTVALIPALYGVSQGMFSPSMRAWQLLGFVVNAAEYVGLAAAAAALIEVFALRGYRGGYSKVGWRQRARSARFWLALALLCAGTLVIFVGLGVCRSPGDRDAALLFAAAGGLGVTFALWQRRLAQLTEGVGTALGATSLADSAAWVARTWWVIALASAAFFSVLILTVGSVERGLRQVMEMLFFVLVAAGVIALVWLHLTMHATANLLARDEGN
jgi:hypothetical protein